ncbi:MAG: hypothetical protein EZS28_018518 [Streblomastix strix]|uniref:Uncharacterized protein n=1 Tax=Streblomastix strix TaxID=222440 RepID=A0A5J4VUD6_9EUKA|nr:MAG: hypothetical protein EZS28_018518 [Streblomastix strix]
MVSNKSTKHKFQQRIMICHFQTYDHEGQLLPGQCPTGPHASRTAARPQSTISPLALHKEQEISEILNVMTKNIKEYMHRCMLNEFDQTPFGKNDEGRYLLGFNS